MPYRHCLVIVPVFNEAKALGAVLEELRAYPGLDVLVVDDASSDDSASLARSLGAHVLPLPFKLGAWGAMQTGIRYALKGHYSQVITMDGDGQHHAEEIRELLDTAQRHEEADVVIGACMARGSRLRRWAWSFFRLINGVSIGDLTSGFRLYNRRAMQVLAQRDATLLEYQDVGILLMLRTYGLKIVETEVSMTARASGKSRVFSSWLMVGYYMLVTTILSLSKTRRSAHTRRRRAEALFEGSSLT